MNYKAPIGFCLLLAACGGGGGAPILGADATYDEAEVAYAELFDEVDVIFQREGVLQTVDAPNAVKTYSGLVIGEGSDFPFDGPTIGYAANLELEVDFNLGDIEGELTNYTTNLAGFTNPEGTMNLVGGLGTDIDGFTSANFGGSTTLTNGAVSADASVFGEGNFTAGGAEAAFGFVFSDFVWVTGPDAGTTSFADGIYDAVE